MKDVVPPPFCIPGTLTTILLLKKRCTPKNLHFIWKFLDPSVIPPKLMAGSITVHDPLEDMLLGIYSIYVVLGLVGLTAYKRSVSEQLRLMLGDMVEGLE